VLAFAPLDAAVRVAYHLVFDLSGPLGPALAIVAVTVALRLLLLPLTVRQVRTERVRAGLAPDLAKLREQHADDPAALARETLALHRTAGVGLFGGLLPALLQAPFLMVLYRLFASPGVPGSVLGAPLHATLAAAGPAVWVFGLLLVLLGVVAWWSSRRLRGVLRVLPFATVAVAMVMPLATGLYLLTTTAWTALENAVLRRGVEVPPPAH
jgi:YidC/Oxa1 family membrane protein insertase